MSLEKRSRKLRVTAEVGRGEAAEERFRWRKGRLGMERLRWRKGRLEARRRRDIEVSSWASGLEKGPSASARTGAWAGCSGVGTSETRRRGGAGLAESAVGEEVR